MSDYLINCLPDVLQKEVEEWMKSKNVSFLELIIDALEYYLDGH